MPTRTHKQIYHQRKAPKKQTKYRRTPLEQCIFDGCDNYRREKTAFIDKVPEPGQMVKYIGNRKFIVRYANEPNNMFTGITRKGRMIAFSYIQSDSDIFGVDCIREKIVDRLSIFQENGALCFVIIATPHGNYYRIPVWMWQNLRSVYLGRCVPADDISIFHVYLSRRKELLFLDHLTDV